MKRARAAIAVAGATILLGGCTYHNTIYNAQRLYDDAERARRAGQDSISVARYTEVIERTAEAYRANPERASAADALFLLGRSRLRLGELREAIAALKEAEAKSEPTRRGEVEVYSAIALAESGDPPAALALVNQALRGQLGRAALGEAHLLRGTLLLARGYADQGWWDLDRAAEADGALRVEAGLERARWAIDGRDRPRARAAVSGLLTYPEGGQRIDAIVGLIDDASSRWGPAAGAELLVDAGSSTWGREARGRIRLERARLLHEAGDTLAAAEQAWGVARGLGVAAAEARILLASWRLARTRDLADARSVRPILLPAGADPRVATLVEAVEVLEVLTGIGLDDPLGWFAAAEVARDGLGADYLARGLFLAYADGAPLEPWAPKALLAAIEVSPSEGDRAWLRGRLEAHGDSPYVLAALGGPAAGFEALEEELEVRLREIRAR